MTHHVDYTNPDEVCAYQVLLTRLYEQEGGFSSPSVANSATREIRQQGSVWLREARFLIRDILDAPFPSTSSALHSPLSAIPGLLSSYDILHRICNATPCGDFLREVKLKTTDLWLHGNKSISKTDVVLMLLSETDRDIHNLDKRFAQYALTILEKWIEELSVHGRFADIPLSEAYRRLAYLLNRDLFVYLGRTSQYKVKKQWAQNYTLSAEQLNDLDTDTLQDYIVFANAESHIGQLSIEEQDTRYLRFLTLLSSRPDLHPFLRKAIEIELQNHSVLSEA